MIAERPWPAHVTTEVRQALANLAFAHERARGFLTDYRAFGMTDDQNYDDIELWFDVTAQACAAIEGVLRGMK